MGVKTVLESLKLSESRPAVLRSLAKESLQTAEKKLMSETKAQIIGELIRFSQSLREKSFCVIWGPPSAQLGKLIAD